MIDSSALIEQYSNSFSNLSESFIGKNIEWVKESREKAFKQFYKDGVPRQDVEEWNTFSYRGIYDNFFANSSEQMDKKIVDKLKPRDKNCPVRMIFYNGKMVKLEEDEPIKGVKINSLKYFLDNCPELIEGKIPDASFYSEHRLSKVVDSRPQGLVALNAAFYQDGAVILVDKNTIVPGYIEIIHIGNASKISMSPVRSVVSLSKNSKCEVVERIVPTEEKTPLYLSNHVTDIELSRFSSLTYLRLVDGNASDIHVNSIHALVNENAELYCPSVIKSQGQSRIESRANLLGIKSNAKIDGLTILNKESISESLTRVMHCTENSKSDQTFRTILNDNSKASFLGKIRVEKSADGTNAIMSSKSLLLSENARANAKPELEILADDVKCSHGVTVGSFNPDQIFYLRSRGISEKNAKQLLTNAFSKIVIDSLPVALSKVSEKFIGVDDHKLEVIDK